jgi:hypothetical protein
MTLTPVQTAIAILVVLAIVGIIIQYVTLSRRFAGFEYIGGAIRGLRKTLKGEISRDGPDLVVVGEYRELPVFVRFSNTLGEAALTIHMSAQAAFGMSVAPASVEVADAGRNEIRTGDTAFDNRFSIRTDQPTQVSLLLTRQILGQVQKLCCSSQTALQVRSGEIELTEPAIPQPQTWEHIVLHLQSMRTLAESARAIPGSETITVGRYQRDRHIPGRVAIAIGVIAAVILVVGSSEIQKQPLVAEAGPAVPAGITPNDAVNIPNLDGWRVAKGEDFPADAQSWTRGAGLEISGTVMGDFSGSGRGDDVAYVLTNDKHQFRLVVIANHANRYDAQFGSLALVARIPKDSAAAVQWNGAPPEAVNGDGLLVVTNSQDRASGIAMFLGTQSVASAAPTDYQSVNLR